MVTAEKTARSMLKQASELGNTLREIVRRDLADETRRFNDTLNQLTKLSFVHGGDYTVAGNNSIIFKVHRIYTLAA